MSGAMNTEEFLLPGGAIFPNRSGQGSQKLQRWGVVPATTPSPVDEVFGAPDAAPPEGPSHPSKWSPKPGHPYDQQKRAEHEQEAEDRQRREAEEKGRKSMVDKAVLPYTSTPPRIGWNVNVHAALPLHAAGTTPEARERMPLMNQGGKKEMEGGAGPGSESWGHAKP